MTNHGPSQRQLKVGETLRHTLAAIFLREEFYDPDNLSEIKMTVSEVRISPDLRNATVYVTPLGGKDQERLIAIINSMAPTIRHSLAKKVHMRHLPQLFFKLDASFDEAGRIETLLNSPKVKQDLSS